MGWNITLILLVMRVYRVFHTVAPSVFSQVDMFHAIAAAARGGHHFIYTVYLCVIASYIVKLNDAL